MNVSCDISYVEVYHLHILYGFLDNFLELKTWQWFETQITLANVAQPQCLVTEIMY